MQRYSLSAIVDLLDRDRADDTVQRVLRAYSTRAATSEKKAPPGFFVLTDHPGNGGIEAVCVGPAWHGSGFEVEIVAAGMGGKRGRVIEARANAWDYYHEVWDEAHAALVAAGALALADNRPSVKGLALLRQRARGR